MSTIQNLKNFIRHGKQARDNKSPADPAVSNVNARYDNRHQQAQPVGFGISEPAFDNRKQQPLHQEYSAAAVDNRNVAAKAHNAAAYAADQQQKQQQQQRQSEKQKQVDKEVLERIVAEEREAKGKLPKYPGLDRYQLIEKMGDGAFSNVYRAKDLKGVYDEVAIKVVRKFEMNATQVSLFLALCHSSHTLFRCIICRQFLLGRQCIASGFQKSPKDGGGQHIISYSALFLHI